MVYHAHLVLLVPTSHLLDRHRVSNVVMVNRHQEQVKLNSQIALIVLQVNSVYLEVLVRHAPSEHIVQAVDQHRAPLVLQATLHQQQGKHYHHTAQFVPQVLCMTL